MSGPSNGFYAEIDIKIWDSSLYHLTTIAGPWYFGRVLVPLRLKNQSLYHKILLLQKFNDISGKVLKPKKIQPPTSKK